MQSIFSIFAEIDRLPNPRDVIPLTKRKIEDRDGMVLDIGGCLCAIRDNPNLWAEWDTPEDFVRDEFNLKPSEFRSLTRLIDRLRKKNIPEKTLAKFTKSQLIILGNCRGFTAKTADQLAALCQSGITNRQLEVKLYPANPKKKSTETVFSLACTNEQREEWHERLAQRAEETGMTKADSMDEAIELLNNNQVPIDYIAIVNGVAQTVLTGQQRRQFMNAIAQAFAAAAKSNDDDDQPGTVQ